jgi:TonB family protein
MLRQFACAIVALLAASFITAQQSPQPAPPPLPIAQPAGLIAYYAGPGATAPELLPFAPAEPVSGHCEKSDGTVVLSAVVDVNGVPHNIYFLNPLGNDLDKLALNVAAFDRFRPGSRDGVPVPVVISVKEKLSACIEKKKDETGQKLNLLRLRSVPTQDLELIQPPHPGATLTFIINDSPLQLPKAPALLPNRALSDISAPQVLKSVEATYSDNARAAKIQGACLISLIVDVHGMPQSLKVLKSLEPGLDQNALYAISRYRFTPALKYGTPIPVRITIEVDFRLY